MEPSIMDAFGEQCFYTKVGFVEGLFCTQTVHLGPGCLAIILQLTFIRRWLLTEVPLYYEMVTCQCQCMIANLYWLYKERCQLALGYTELYRVSKLLHIHVTCITVALTTVT